MDAYRPKRFALTGGTGALGFAFLRYNLQRLSELQVTLLVRQGSSAFQSADFQTWLRENSARITLVEGDVRELDREQTDALLSTDGGLWHFAALTSLVSDDEDLAHDIHAVNVEGTRLLVEAGLAHPACGPFYHISTAYVMGDRSGSVLETESALGQGFRNPYEASKLAAETLVGRLYQAGIKGAVFRPSIVVDDSGRTGGFKMIDVCAYGVALAVKRGEPFVFRLRHDANVNMIHSDWVIAAMTDLARLPSGSGRTYHLSAPRQTYMRDIATILERLAPNLKISFAPDLPRNDLPVASKIVDKALVELRSYFEAGVCFDRVNTDRDLSTEMTATALDLEVFVQSRLDAEMERIAHRKSGRAESAAGIAG